MAVSGERSGSTASNRKNLPVCILDSDAAQVKSLAAWLDHAGFPRLIAASPQHVLDLVRSGECSLVLAGAKIPQMETSQFLEYALAADPAVNILILGGSHSSPAALTAAVNSLLRGAHDFLPKPLDYARLAKSLDEIVELRATRAQVRELEDRLLPHLGFHGMLGKSPAMLQVFDLARKASRLNAGVLISGPSGCGKKLLARAIHQMGAANSAPFVLLQCAGLQMAAAPNQSSAYQRGMGAASASQGAFDAPYDGTILLDEVHLLPAAAQLQLLRTIEARTLIHGNGGFDSHAMAKKADIRFIAASSSNLREEAAAGRLDEALLARLSGFEIRIPPLTARVGDIPILIRYFLRMHGHARGRNFRGLTRRAQIALFQHDWPGNVRELENVIAGAAAVASGDFLDLADLPPLERQPAEQPHENADGAGREDVWQPISLAEMRRIHIERVLAACKGNRVRAARALGIGRTSLYRFMKSPAFAKAASASSSSPS